MAPLVLDRHQVRQFDQIATDQFEMSSLVLMENAARGASDVLCQRASEHSAVILCGPGNNGGDGLVMARHLHLRGWRTKVLFLTDSRKLSPDSAANLRILRHTAVSLAEAAAASVERFQQEIQGFAWIVDAILGTGSRAPLGEPLDRFVLVANDQACGRLAIDLPSGLDCDGRGVPGTVFRADLTVTFVARKPVMQTATGKKYCGEITIVDIGAPPEVFAMLDDSQISQNP